LGDGLNNVDQGRIAIVCLAFFDSTTTLIPDPAWNSANAILNNFCYSYIRLTFGELTDLLYQAE